MKEQRIDLIMKEVEKHGIVSVSDLMKKLGVTRMTIGRDLKLLEDSGMLKRTHGGAVKNDDLNLVELTHLQKKNINISKKEEIGKLATDYIENGDIIFIGASTTNECLLKNIKNKVAEYLLGKLTDDKCSVIQLSETQQDIADFFGVTRPSLARALAEMEQEGIISIDRKTIVIHKRSVLQQLSQ